ncbi:hypothetical protein D5H75_33175 [Bailinhaonella thermotolerans]|uniref:Uncharacterized protein n=1 Tax=Bailinhaonella thermotolerans TaxID=1070861 RepID=A0A3A4A385_9ACTN|nr:hypothetical protein D5H75_33175 [Bailinhaonella thermotolerans]
MAPTEPAAYLECRWRSVPEHRAAFRFAPGVADSWRAVAYLEQKQRQGDAISLAVYPDVSERRAAHQALDKGDVATLLALAVGVEDALDRSALAQVKVAGWWR